MTAACDIAWLNDRFLPLAEARVSPLDRGFLFADAVYEVLPVYDGGVYRLEQHLDRLDRSLREIRMAEPMPRERWHSLCGGLVERNGGGNLLLYLQVSRGAEAMRSHVPAATLKPTVFGMASPAEPPSPDPSQRGVACITAGDIRWARCDIKATALLGNVLLKWRAQDAGAGEALLLRDGHLTEGSSSSAHVVLDGELISPGLDNTILPGTTREVLHEVAAACGVTVRVAAVGADRLRQASEIIIASAGAGLRAVTQLDGQAVGADSPGPVFTRLYRAWLDGLAASCTRCTE